MELTSFTAQASREIHPDTATPVIYSEEQKAQRKGSNAELPGKTQIIFTVCLRYCLEHTYMKNYSSLAENSNLTGPPGFLLAVFGNYAPSPHGRQTLEREKATDPCMCSVVRASHSSSHCFLSGFLLDAHEAQGRYLYSHQSCQRKPGPGHGETAHSKAQPTHRLDT